MSGQPFAVFLDDPSDLARHLPAIAKVVARALGEYPTDVTQRLRYGGGLVTRDVPEAAARELARNLAAFKVGSFLTPTAELQPPPRPRRVGAFVLGDEGLGIAPLLRPEKVASLPWREVVAVHTHALSESAGSEEREALPRRGGNLRQLPSATRRILADIRKFEERERTVVAMGLDVLVKGPSLYRLRHDQAGLYGSLEPSPLPEGERLLPISPAEALSGADWEGVRGGWVRWQGLVQDLDAEAGSVTVAAGRQGEGATLRLRLRRVDDAVERDLEVGLSVSFRARLDAREDEALVLGDAELELSTHSLGNFLALVRKLVRLAPPSVLVPPGTRRFAATTNFTEVLYYKREELDAVNTWVLQAAAQGLDSDAAPEEIPDDLLEDPDEGIPVPATADEDVDEIDDDELQDDEAQDVAERDVVIRLDGVEVGEDDEPLDHTDDDLEAVDADLDPEVLEHFDRSRRFDQRHIRELISAAESLDSATGGLESALGALEEEAANDPELAEAMSFFDVKSGKWRVADVLAGHEDLDVDDIVEGEPDDA